MSKTKTSSRKSVRINSKAEIEPSIGKSLNAEQEALSSKNAPVVLPAKSPLKSSLKQDAAEDVEEILKGFESEEASEGEDSSDAAEGSESEEEIRMDELPPVTVSNPPSTSKKAAKTGVLYLGRLPKGFEEKALEKYLAQFGSINRLRLSRNKRTAASKHYAFIEFTHKSVAEIVVETMDNYLLHGHLLKCELVDESRVHPKMWVGAGKKYRVQPKGRKERIKHNEEKTDEQKETITKRLSKRESAKRKKLDSLGIEYDFPGYAGKRKEAPEATVVEEATEKPAAKKQKKARKSAPV